MLLSVLSTQHEPEVMERRFGFRAIRPLPGDTGQERFGVLEGAGGAPAAVLRLYGHDLALADPRVLRDTVETLAAALPDSPVQFLLSRRRMARATLLPPLHEALWARFADRPAVRSAVWDDLREAQLPRLEAAGLADLWAGVAVPAADPPTLVQRVAGLYINLPFDATPLLAGDLGRLVHRLLRPDAPPPPVQAELPWPFGSGDVAESLADLLPRKLLIGEDAVSLAPGSLTCYWLLLPPFPETPGGWVWRLLEFPALREYEWDLAVHLRPAATEDAMRGVLEQRLARVTADLAAWGAAPATRPPPDAPEAQTAAWLLELERRDLADRLATLSGDHDRMREATVLLALHTQASEHAALSPGGTYRDRWLAQQAGEEATAPEDGEPAGHFGAALRAAGFVARPVHGRRMLAQAVRAVLPLAVAEGLRGFPLSGAQAAGLALAPMDRPLDAPGAPLLGVTRSGSPFRPFPEATGLPGHRLITGGVNGDRRLVAAQWALSTYQAGVDLLIYDPAGHWAGFVAALGGRVLRPGAADSAGVADLLAVDLATLIRPSGFEVWGHELADLFAALLAPRTGQPLDVIESQVGSALLQLGLRALDPATPAPLTLSALYEELREGGYTTTAQALAALRDQPGGRLFTTAPPPSDAGLLCIGPPDPALSAPAGTLAAAIALRRTLAAPPADRWRACLLDPLPAALAHPALVQDLVDLLAGEPPDRTALWALMPPTDLPALLAGPYAELVAALPLRVFLPSGGSLGDVAATLGVPTPACAQISALAPGQALACQDGDCTLLQIVLGDWVAHFGF